MASPNKCGTGSTVKEKVGEEKGRERHSAREQKVWMRWRWRWNQHSEKVCEAEGYMGEEKVSDRIGWWEQDCRSTRSIGSSF